MHGALVIDWGRSITGREGKGLEVFTQTLAHFDHLAKKGRVAGHHEYFRVVGPAGGMMVIEGELDELMKIQAEDDTRRLLLKANAIVDDLRVSICSGGTEASLQQDVQRYAESMQDLGYM